jgi:hypothetical protein
MLLSLCQQINGNMLHTPPVTVNISALSDSNDLKFKKVANIPNMVDVIYKGNRIAIINGFTSPLQWTAPNGSNIPNKIIDRLEKLVINNLV